MCRTIKQPEHYSSCSDLQCIILSSRFIQLLHIYRFKQQKTCCIWISILHTTARATSTIQPGLWPGPSLMHSINPNPVSYTRMTATATAVSPQDMAPKPFKLKFETNQIKVCQVVDRMYRLREVQHTQASL